MRFLMLLSLLGLGSVCLAATPKRVALIFDDGPVSGAREGLLRVLQEAGVPATFGTVAQKALALPALVQAATEAGCETVNHSWSHAHPKPLSDEDLATEIVAAQKAFVEQVGVTPKWYWPPFLEEDPRMEALFSKAGLKIYRYPHIVVSGDWMTELSGEEIRSRATTDVKDGSVILFHEWRAETLAEMPAILAELKTQGCEFLSFSALAESLAATRNH